MEESKDLSPEEEKDGNDRHEDDDVVMKEAEEDEEKEQQQQQQQQQPNVEEKEEKEEEAKVNNNNNNNNNEGDNEATTTNANDIKKQKAHEKRVRDWFNKQLERIERNDPKYKIYDFEMMLDDANAIRLARALNGNAHLQLLRIMVGPNLTSRGARALVGGMSGSQIKIPAIQAADELPHDLAELVIHPLTTTTAAAATTTTSVERIILSFTMSDEMAALLGSAMVGNESLLHLGVQVQQMTPRAAESLAAGIRGAKKLTHIDISVRPGMTVEEPDAVMQALLLQGVHLSSSPNLQHLELIRIVGDMNAIVTVLPKLSHLTMMNVVIHDEMAAILGHALGSASSSAGAEVDPFLLLENLVISLDGMTPNGAQLIANGIRTGYSRRRHRIKYLELNHYNHNMDNDKDHHDSMVSDETIMQAWFQELFQGPTTTDATTTDAATSSMEHLCLSGVVVGDIMSMLVSSVLPQLGEFTLEKLPQALTLEDTNRLCRGIVADHHHHHHAAAAAVTTTTTTTASKLHTLHLNECGLTSDHMNVLTSILMTHEPLKHIDVSGNQIGDHGIAAMILNYTPNWIKDQTWNYANNQTMFDIR